LEAERDLHNRQKVEFAEALQSEIAARTRDVRELAKSLQSECNARAGEVEQLAVMFQSEREARVQDAQEMADTLRTELTTPSEGAGQAQQAGTGAAVSIMQAETDKLSTRVNELTEFVLSERDARTRESDEIRGLFKGTGKR